MKKIILCPGCNKETQFVHKPAETIRLGAGVKLPERYECEDCGYQIFKGSLNAQKNKLRFPS